MLKVIDGSLPGAKCSGSGWMRSSVFAKQNKGKNISSKKEKKLEKQRAVNDSFLEFQVFGFDPLEDFPLITQWP